MRFTQMLFIHVFLLLLGLRTLEFVLTADAGNNDKVSQENNKMERTYIMVKPDGTF